MTRALDSAGSPCRRYRTGLKAAGRRKTVNGQCMAGPVQVATMISPRDLHVRRMLRNLGRTLALLVWLDIVVVVAYVYFEQ